MAVVCGLCWSNPVGVFDYVIKSLGDAHQSLPVVECGNGMSPRQARPDIVAWRTIAMR